MGFVALAACTAATPMATPTPIPTSAPPTALPTPTFTFTPTATLLPTATLTPSATLGPRPVPGALYVDAAADLGKVSPLAFGANHGPWAFLNADNYGQFRESGVTLLRFPGGNWGDENNLDAFQIDMFLMVARLNNAEPLVSVRLRGGAPELALAAMQYMRQQGQTARYWSIGNEPSLYASADPQWDTTYFNAEWRRFAQAMKAADPNIRLVGPDTHQFMGEPGIDPKDAQGRDWLREFLKANGDLVDVVAVHRYPFPVVMGERPTRDQLFADAPRWDTLVTNLRKVVREETGQDKPIAITEFNSSWSGAIGGETGMDTLNNALWLGDVLGRLIRARVDIVSYFSLQSGANVGGYGLFARDTPRPTYYTYQMFRDFGDRLVFAASDTPRLSLYAAATDKALTLIIVNLNDQPVTRPLVLDHFAIGGPAKIRLFDKDQKATDQPAATLTSRSDFTVPPLSITRLTIPGKADRGAAVPRAAPDRPIRPTEPPTRGRLIWSDEFDGPTGAPPDETKWGYEIGGHGWGNAELQYYTNRPENAALDGNGALVITAKREDPDTTTYRCLYGACMYSSARLLTKGRFEFTYGRVEARIKIPSGQGIWPAFWMLGADINSKPWPSCGEIDILENIGKEPTTVHGTIHGPGYAGSAGLSQSYSKARPFAEDYHDYAVHWEPQRIRWYVDGNLYGTKTPADLEQSRQWVFDHPFYLLLNVAVGGQWPGLPDATTHFPQMMQVDYVRVYQD